MSSTQVPASSGSSDNPKLPVSSGSEGDPQYVVIDERKKRRMISNRESARRSRMRKQQHLDELLNQVAQLQQENNGILQRINATAEVYVNVESENSILRAQMTELSDRLHSLNSVLRIIEEVSGFSMDIPEIPDPLLKPWQLPCPSMPITASSSMFKF
ncbi:Bzip transcription factor [Thalictrum thalictroides]|uniref:Bzip transcription factor n=1 Tax=Thalictrum thalictroides TaxID=46969 RepID=A0A7J6VXP1_THATH|nr:Bzip transcription factor [Thalictrum thalictroides]